MKIKFSKVLAIVCALSVAFAGLTAFAAPGNVTVTTTYDVYYDGNMDSVAKPVIVTAEIHGEANKEVTYYVENSGNIVYINQYTIPADPGYVTSTFTTSHSGLLSAVAKFGTDGSAGDGFPEFTFVNGSNCLSNGTASVQLLTEDAEYDDGYAADITYDTFKDDGTADGTATAAYVFKAKVSGNAKEYGIKVDGDKFQAVGCEVDGTFMVVINGVDISKKIEAYAIDAKTNTEATVTIKEVTTPTV